MIDYVFCGTHHTELTQIQTVPGGWYNVLQDLPMTYSTCACDNTHDMDQMAVDSIT